VKIVQGTEMSVTAFYAAVHTKVLLCKGDGLYLFGSLRHGEGGSNRHVAGE
jgi:hypothetical protein